MSKFRLSEITDLELWDSEVAHSPQYSIFANTIFLNSLLRKYKLYFVYRGRQVKSAFTIFVDECESSIELDDLCIHNSIMFFANSEQKLINSRQEEFEVTEFIIEQLDEKFESIALSLSPQIKDIRPFQWHNYFSDSAGDKFLIDTRYTSILDISELFLKKDDDKMTMFQNMESKRQTDIHRAKEANVVFSESSDVETFITLYAQLLESQDSSVSEQYLDKMRNVIKTLLRRGLCTMFFTIDESSQVTYACVFSHHQNVGCYLYGAGNRDIMRRFDATYCIWNSIKALSNLGVREVDLEGVNSPTRGQFKLGFGGDLRSYFQVFKSKLS